MEDVVNNMESGGGGDSGDAYTATVTFAVQGADWIGVSVKVVYLLEDALGYSVQFGSDGRMGVPSTAPTVKLPLLKDVTNSWDLIDLVFYAPDGETQLQGSLHFTGDINPDGDILGDCTITLNVGGQ
jgi:hypothetical protein